MMKQRIESLDGHQRERFMLHYNFLLFQLVKLEELELEDVKLVMVNLAWRAINFFTTFKRGFSIHF
jgi:polyribonucleotide nucleotidyltransferase